MYSKRLASLTCALAFAGCAFGLNVASASAATLQGAGSTLVAPIEAYWATAWDSQTGNTVTYNSVGSTTGFKDVAGGLTDFGASDAPISAYSTYCAHCVQIPWALTATGVSYHLAGIRSIRLTGPVIASIYLGSITNWDDPAIKALNPKTHLPNLKITPYFRSDGSGDTYAFTKYESEVSSAFASKIGSSTTVSWPTGVGAKGNGGMATAVQQTNGAIAYIAVSYLIANQLPAVAIKNAAGRFEVPNLNAIEAAAKVVHHVPGGNQVTIVNPPKRAKTAYPISTFTYVVVPTNAKQGALLRSFIGYAITGGQSFGPRLDFAPLPKDILAADQATLNTVN